MDAGTTMTIMARYGFLTMNGHLHGLNGDTIMIISVGLRYRLMQVSQLVLEYISRTIGLHLIIIGILYGSIISVILILTDILLRTILSTESIITLFTELTTIIQTEE